MNLMRSPSRRLMLLPLALAAIFAAGSASGDDLDRFFQSVRTRQPQPR